jgi:hypothetical protein
MRNNGQQGQKRLNVQHEPGVLVFAANDDNRRELADRIVAATEGKYPVRAKTPLGFFQDEGNFILALADSALESESAISDPATS